MDHKLNFITADDHNVVTKSLGFILRDLYPDANVIEVHTISDVTKTLYTSEIDLLLLDITFPDGNTLNIIPVLKTIQPNLKILIFSGLDEDIYAVRCINAGVNGFLSKLSSEEEIKKAITEVLVSKKYISKNIQEKIMNDYIFKKPKNPIDQLTNRELEIAQLIIEGFKSTEIANTLNLQKSTVSTYKNRIFEKLGIDNIPDLIKKINLYENMK